jgi:hypothetical protein
LIYVVLGVLYLIIFFDSDDDIKDIIYDSNYEQLVYKNKENYKYSVENLILKWITDSNNHNILYKSNGTERYPGFKLYKMIAIKSTNRCCPFMNIESEYFNEFIISLKNKKNN